MARLDIAVLVGSLRKESVNRKLANALAKLGERRLAMNFVRIDDIPLYNQDNEQTPAPQVTRLKKEISASQGVLFVTPEYNRSIPGVLKNAIDHASRPYGHSAFPGKPAGVIGASGGKAGTALAQQHLRNVIAYLDMPVLQQPEAFIQFTDGLIDDDGNVANDSTRKFLQTYIDRYADWAERFVA